MIPENTFALTYEEVVKAAAVLNGQAHRTPVLTSITANRLSGATLFFKCENFQRMGAFKFRGAAYALSRLSTEQKRRGILAFSSGNHAQAIALAAQLQGISATIVMPSDAPAVKVAATQGYGAAIHFYDREREDREQICATLSEATGRSIIPPFNHPDVIAGQGTAAKELFEEVGALDYLFVCLGGGGLLAGSALAAAALSPNCTLIGVEPEAGDDARQSLRAGKIVRIPVPKTIADGAQTQQLGTLTWPIIQRYVADIHTVSDDALRAQLRFFFERMKLVVEPTGCLAAAAVMQSPQIDFAGARIGIIVSGGNIDAVRFVQCLG
jgi:threonine dehydratase